MEESFRCEMSDVLTCSVDDVDASARRMLDVFRKRVRLGVMLYFRIVEVDGEPYYDRVYASGERDAVEVIEGLEGGPVKEAPTLNVSAPDTDEINTFAHHDVDPGEFSGWPIYEEAFESLDMNSAARLLVYREADFAGWFGCYRRGDQPRADGELCRDLAPLADPVCSAVTTLDRIRDDKVLDTEEAAVFTPDGKLDYASPEVRDFLDEQIREHMAHVVKKLDGGDIAKSVQIVGGLEVRTSRLTGSGEIRYLAQFIPPTVPSLDPMSKLTPAQREVADFAVIGATNAEIAETTDRSVETVKVHVRNIYDRLDIGSRVELVHKLSG